MSFRPAPRAELRYFAFLSYSHKDRSTAAWLHRELERFKVPSSLVGQALENGRVPERLRPIFRDEHELAAAGDLAAEIRSAIAASRFLIVLCSPAAAASRWTNAEIEAFKRARPDGCVLAAICSGEPFASDMPGREHEECFPPALRVRYDRRGRPTSKRAEPLAADLRDHRDGKRAGTLKLVAGMLGVGLDALVQRDHVRRQRRLALLAAASLAGMAVTSTLAVTAMQARDSAREQRREAEGLVGFMLGDLRTKLEPLGRLDVLDSVGSQALNYFRRQDKASLSDEALAQRGRALTLMGEIANSRGDLDGALRQYREAFASSEELLRRAPDQPQRLFDHAQNVFWIGYIDWQRGNLQQAETAFGKYKQLADRMVALQPDARKWQLERAYADTNLGAVLLQAARYRDAASAFARSTREAERLAAAAPDDAAMQSMVVESLAYLSEALEKSGRLEEALTKREQQIALLERAGGMQNNATLKRQLMAALRSRGRLLAARGDAEAGLREARRSVALARELYRIEPDNTEWMEAGAGAELELGELAVALGHQEEAGVAVRAGCDTAERLRARDTSVSTWRSGLAAACLRGRALVALRTGDAQAAQGFASRAVALVGSGRAGTGDRPLAVASAYAVLGDAERKRGNADAARAAYQKAMQSWPTSAEGEPRHMALQAVLLAHLGQRQQAAAIKGKLGTIGYRHPDYLRALQGGAS